MTTKILIIDDSAADQFLCKHVISDYDDTIHVIEAHDGQGALDILSTEDAQPNLILLDINMPGIGGFDFLKQYQNMKITHLPVIILTSSNQDADLNKASSYSCVKGYLEKPLSVERLENLFARLRIRNPS